jgi:hypothetical protein
VYSNREQEIADHLRNNSWLFKIYYVYLIICVDYLV